MFDRAEIYERTGLRMAAANHGAGGMETWLADPEKPDLKSGIAAPETGHVADMEPRSPPPGDAPKRSIGWLGRRRMLVRTVEDAALAGHGLTAVEAQALVEGAQEVSRKHGTGENGTCLPRARKCNEPA